LVTGTYRKNNVRPLPSVFNSIIPSLLGYCKILFAEI